MSEKRIQKIKEEIEGIKEGLERKEKEKNEAQVRLDVLMEGLKDKFGISTLGKAEKELEIMGKELEELSDSCIKKREKLEIKVKEFDGNL